MQRLSPFGIMNTLFAGLGASFAYGLIGSAFLFLFASEAEAKSFFVAYSSSFRTLVSLGLIIGTALVVSHTQHVIPRTIEAAFDKEQLADTQYGFYKRRFYSLFRSVAYSANFIVLGFVIFSQSHFPLTPPGEALMITAACIQYALGVYVGRKLCYAGMMLHSLLKTTATKNLFRNRELDEINAFVHIASTLTVIFVYIHVIGCYEGEFLFDRVLGRGIKPFLLLPAIIALPVLLIFNFYPRAVLRKLYGESIEIEIRNLRETLRDEGLSAYEKRSYLMETERMSREELRYSLQLTLSDVPIGITILIMVIEPILNS
jgi:hypothetical protein